MKQDNYFAGDGGVVVSMISKKDAVKRLQDLREKADELGLISTKAGISERQLKKYFRQKHGYSVVKRKDMLLCTHNVLSDDALYENLSVLIKKHGL